MRGLFQGIEESEIAGALHEGWGLDVQSLEYAAVGAGSYHWLVSDRDGTRGFVTVDDLDGKLWLGDTRESVLAGLERAFDTARALADHGLPFVTAPIPTGRGETLQRLGPGHTVALFPLVDGEAGRWGEPCAAERAAVLELLAQLHASTPAVSATATSLGLQLPGRQILEAALRDLEEPWTGGPFSERAREGLARHAPAVVELVALADRFAADIDRRGAPWAITHGEPHPGNVMRTGDGYVLVDWDTVALAPRERDLWMVADGGGAEAYARATGYEPDAVAVDFFRLTWDLKDLAEYLNVFRSPHSRNEDTERCLEFVQTCGSVRDRWAALLDGPP
jgi:spectinomycin phosphotransferase